jgi:hypothetical protein
MGQYWVPVLAGPDRAKPFAKDIEGWAYAHDFGGGLKLMEHAYVNDMMVMEICRHLHGRSQRVVWAGDYADPEPEGKNLYNLVRELHMMPMKISPSIEVADAPEFKWLLNIDKCEYVNLSILPGEDPIHPLPLLTADSNGRGGGDYTRGAGMKYVGQWAGNNIGIAEEISGVLLNTWKELRPDFQEN